MISFETCSFHLCICSMFLVGNKKTSQGGRLLLLNMPLMVIVVDLGLCPSRVLISATNKINSQQHHFSLTSASQINPG